MPARERIRKCVTQLTPEDLQCFPVWVLMAGADEAEDVDEVTAAPWTPRGPFDLREGPAVLRARFTLADGTELPGYFSASEDWDRGLCFSQPVIVTARGQVSLWLDFLKPTPKLLERWYAVLGKTADQVFPVRFRSGIELADGPVAGTAEGFGYLERVRFLLRTRTLVRTVR
jgi:hypothetical protein